MNVCSIESKGKSFDVWNTQYYMVNCGTLQTEEANNMPKFIAVPLRKSSEKNRDRNSRMEEEGDRKFRR
jgi:hypothetical protein